MKSLNKSAAKVNEAYKASANSLKSSPTTVTYIFIGCIIISIFTQLGSNLRSHLALAWIILAERSAESGGLENAT